MIKRRVIPVLLLKDGLLVRSQSFSYHQYIGNPYHEVERFNEWNVDELIYLDIGDGNEYTQGRDDTKIKQVHNSLELLPVIAKTCFMPLTFGGGIRSLSDIEKRVSLGADKVCINTAAHLNPDFIYEATSVFGSQCIVVGIDFHRRPDGSYTVLSNRGKHDMGIDPLNWAKKLESLGAGEILLQSVDLDGTGEGFDIKIIQTIASAVKIPVIALGGAGKYSDFADVIEFGHADAVAAANIFHFKELTDRHIKRELARRQIPVRL